ncbi:MAG: HAD family hydrolase, partial [Elusimicrobiota bacterium]
MVKAIFFDLDGTLTQVKSPWQRIHEKLGMWEPEGVKHLNDWLAGRIDYDTFFFRDVAMWMGRERQVLEGALAGIPFWPQTAPLLAELKKRGLPAIIISSG